MEDMSSSVANHAECRDEIVTGVNTISRFGPSANISRPLLERNIRDKVPNITMAGWLSSPVAAQLGYLISRILGTNNVSQHRYTLFANSALEAMYAVIRLCRQTSRNARGPNAHKVLIYDINEQYRPFFDPLGVGANQALCPQVHFASSREVFLEKIEGDPTGWACTIVIRYPGHAIDRRVQDAIDAMSEETGALRVVANSEIAIYDPSLFYIPQNTDVVIFGENLTDCETPFGAFSVTETAYSAWNTRQSLSTYTSTFFGNTTTLATALEALRSLTKHVSEVDEHVFASIEENFETRLDYFQRYVHPVYADLFRSEKGDLHILAAENDHLRLANGKQILDLSGLGCSLRGHNPQDVIDNVLEPYDPGHDYLAEVAQELRELTSFAHVLPSVSGAGAVDAAIVTALLANAPRRKIVCLSGNYSGKTLASVNFSKTAPLLADRDQSAFEPYYHDAIYIDPFAEGALEEFERVVSGDDIALVWFEFIQGYMFRRLPAEIVAAVERHKEVCGYLIGVDEVLTGMWKNGRSILFHQNEMSKVDMVTMSKATSDLVFPISWALVTDAVYRAAQAKNSQTLRTIQNFYRNNLGAAIALNGLRTARCFFEENDLTGDLKAFHADLRGVVVVSPLFEGVTTEGSLARLNLNKESFPYQEGSTEGTLVESAISKLLLHSTGIQLTNLRMFLPCIHDARQREEVIARLSSGLARITPASVYAYMLCQDYELLNALGMKAGFKTALLSAAAA